MTLRTRFRCFTRTWWKIDANGNKVPGPGKSRFLAFAATFEQARDICSIWNRTHEPGPLSRKAEFHEEEVPARRRQR